MAGGSRIEAARRRAAGAKRLVAAGAGVSFVAGLFLVRAGHPGHAAASTGARVPSVQSSGSTAQTGSGLDFGFGNIAPSDGAAQAGTSVS